MKHELWKGESPNISPQTMHYAFSEKEVQKCSTLNSCSSTDFHRKIVKFCTKLS